MHARIERRSGAKEPIPSSMHLDPSMTSAYCALADAWGTGQPDKFELDLRMCGDFSALRG